MAVTKDLNFSTSPLQSRTACPFSNPRRGTLGVSKNRGFPPKSSILIGFSIINHLFGVSLFSETSVYYQNDRETVTIPWVLYYSGDGALCFFLRSLLHFQKFAIPWRANLLWQLLWSFIHSGWARKLGWGWTLPLIDEGSRLCKTITVGNWWQLDLFCAW